MVSEVCVWMKTRSTTMYVNGVSKVLITFIIVRKEVVFESLKLLGKVSLFIGELPIERETK